MYRNYFMEVATCQLLGTIHNKSRIREKTLAVRPGSPHNLVHRLRNSCFGLQLSAIQSGSWPSLYVSAQHEVCFLLESFSLATNGGRIVPRFAPSMKFSLDLVHSALTSTEACINYSRHGFLFLWASHFYVSRHFFFILISWSDHYNDILTATWDLPNEVYINTNQITD